MSSYGAGLRSTGLPGCENTLPHSNHCHYQYTKITSTTHLKLLGLVQPGKGDNTHVTLPHEPSEALRLTLSKTQPSSPQDTLVKRGYVKRGTIYKTGYTYRCETIKTIQCKTWGKCKSYNGPLNSHWYITIPEKGITTLADTNKHVRITVGCPEWTTAVVKTYTVQKVADNATIHSNKSSDTLAGTHDLNGPG